MSSNRLRKRALQALHLFLWIVVIWLGYAAGDGLIHMERHSKAEYADSRSLLVIEAFLTAIFAGLAISLVFVIGSLRRYLSKQLSLSQQYEHGSRIHGFRAKLRSLG